MTRPPLVYLSAAAREAAAELTGAAVAENAIAELIAAGSVSGDGQRGYVIGRGWRAAFVRAEGKFRPRPRVWLVHALERCSGCDPGRLIRSREAGRSQLGAGRPEGSLTTEGG